MTDRLPRLTPTSLDAAQAQVYEEITGGPRAKATRLVDAAGALEGPFNAMLIAPRVGLHLQRLGSAIRYETSLPPAAREIAILLCARAEQSEFEWYAHAPLARAAGVPDAVVDAIQAGEPVTLDDFVEDAVATVTADLLATGDLSDAAYRAAEAVLGDAQLVELCVLVGYYRLLSTLLRTFRVPLPNEAGDADATA